MVSSLLSYAYSGTCSGIISTAKYLNDNVVTPSLERISSAASSAYAAATTAVEQLAGHVAPLVGNCAAYLSASRINHYVQTKVAAFQFPQQNAARYLQSEIERSKKISRAKKSIANRAVGPLLRGLGWISNLDSFKSLVTSAGYTLATYTKALSADSVREKGAAFIQASQSEDELQATGARASYRDAIAQSLGYASHRDLERQALKAVKSQAGHFISRNSERGPLRPLINFFKSVYRSIVGLAAGKIAKKRIALLTRGLPILTPILKRLSRITSEEESRALSLLINTQADVFALFALHSLSGKHKEVQEGALYPEGLAPSLRENLTLAIEQTSNLFLSDGMIKNAGTSFAKRAIEAIDFEEVIKSMHHKLTAWVSSSSVDQ